MCHICSRLVQLFVFFPSFFLICDPPHYKCPLGLEGLIVFSLCPFTGEFIYVRQILSRSFLLFGSFPRFMNWRTPNLSCLSVMKGLFVLAHVHSQMNMHMCAKFGPDRSSCLASFPHFCMCEPLTPSKYPLWLSFLWYWANIHLDSLAQACAGKKSLIG